MTEVDDTPGRPRTSTRDHDELRERLARWLVGRLPAGARPRLSALDVPASTGMSSETLLFDVTRHDGGQTRAERWVARLRPDPSAVPVFPTYDLERQFRVMRLVGERTAVPVPRTLWFEPDEEPLGSPFFVMERVDGHVPPDIMPYPFGSWLSDASPHDQRRLQRASVGILADVHGMVVTPREVGFLELDRPGTTALRRHVADQTAFYDWVTADGVRSPVIERAFGWLEAHWPVEETPAVVSWGDSRIGNVLYRDFRPVAVLDWEMAALAPREMDLGWMIYLHRFFQDIAESAGLLGMPDFLRPDDVLTTYEELTGHAPRDFEFYALYAALRHGIIMFRIARRSVHFGEAPMPDDPDDLVMHRATLERMVEGTYWH